MLEQPHPVIEPFLVVEGRNDVGGRKATWPVDFPGNGFHPFSHGTPAQKGHDNDGHVIQTKGTSIWALCVIRKAKLTNEVTNFDKCLAFRNFRSDYVDDLL